MARPLKRKASPASEMAAKSEAAITLDRLPPDLSRRRLLNTAEAAEFCKISVPHWRRLYRNGHVPKPVRLSVRKYGWRLGDLLDFIDARITTP